MNSKIYLSLTVSILIQIFFGVSFISAQRSWVPMKYNTEDSLASSAFGKFLTLSDVLQHQKTDTNHTIPCYQKDYYESLIKNFTTNLTNTVSKFGTYLRCRYGETYIKTQDYLNCIKDTIKSYPEKLEGWIKGETFETLGTQFLRADSDISQCDLGLTVQMKMIPQKSDAAARNFIKLIDNTRNEAKIKSKDLMHNISTCIHNNVLSVKVNKS